MAPTPVSPRRQSCDRCHGQKLRCTRADSDGDSGPCVRCIRQRAHCVYSSCLPKGRPSIYRVSGISATSPGHSTVASTVPMTPVSSNNLSQSRSRRPRVDSATRQKPRSTINTDASVNAMANTPPEGKPDASGDRASGDSLSSFLSTWPLSSQGSWTHAQVVGAEEDWLADLQSIAIPHLETNAALLDSLVNLPDWATSDNSDCPEMVGSQPESSCDTSASSHSDSSRGGSIERPGAEFGIAQLSQLSMRLYQLHQSSSTLSNPAEFPAHLRPSGQSNEGSVMSDRSFKSVVSWLVPDSGSSSDNILAGPSHPSRDPPNKITGNTLYDAFSASQNLLEIMHYLQETATADSTSTTRLIPPGSSGAIPAESQTDVSDNGSHSRSMQLNQPVQSDERPPHIAHPQHRFPITVLRHLVIACHTLLLTIYVAVLAALQQDVDQGTQRPSGNAHGHASLPSVSLANIRVVMVVQLCSYLIERQRKAVALYLSLQPIHGSSPLGEPHGSHQRLVHPDVPSEQELEVQEQITRLRQALNI